MTQQNEETNNGVQGNQEGQQAQTNQEVVPPAEPAKVLTYEEHQKELQKVLADMHKYKSKATEFEIKAKTQEEQRLKEANDWKTLYEREKEEREQLLNQFKEVETQSVKKEKLTKIREMALKAGIVPQALGDLEMLPFSEVKVEKTEFGNLKIEGVESAVEMLKQTRPHWFMKKSTQVNSRIPETKNDASVVTEAELIKMSLEAQKTGDYAAYRQKLTEFTNKKGA
jgi:hypothetical protein